MSTQVDLSQLARARPAAAEIAPRRRRAWLSRYVAPGALLCGFLAMLAWAFRESLTPARPVTVTPVVASRSWSAAADTPLFQAAGWVEPRPQPVVVTALVEGIVEEMLVVAGDSIAAGQVVARLVKRDAEIALARAEAEVRLRAGELAAAHAARQAASANFNEPTALQAASAEAQAALSKLETELARLPAMMRAAEAKRQYAEQEVAGKAQAAGAVAAINLRRAQSELETLEAQLEEYRQQQQSLAKEREALRLRRDAVLRQLELKVEETRQVADAEAQVEIAEAQVQQAESARDAARLALSRTEVKAPSAGRVLDLVAKPGSRLMGVDRASPHDASTVLTMYDPASLQVRADVRLDDVPHVSVGQAVQIESPVTAKPLAGRVLMATALTDIQKNTLQVKVTIDDTPPELKPDMLVQATFLAPPRPEQDQAAAPLKILAPRRLIDTAEGEAAVWLADQANNRAVRRRITMGGETSDGLVEVLTGLAVGDRLIVSPRESLRDGEAIRIAAVETDVVGAGKTATAPATTPDHSQHGS